jgi:hypothetical protein
LTATKNTFASGAVSVIVHCVIHGLSTHFRITAMDIITCEFCGKNLQVPPNAYGQMVQCPMCKNTFQAKASGAVQAQAPPPMPSGPEEPRYDEEKRPRGPDRWGEDEEGEYRRRSVVPHRGSTILTLGILSLVICGPIMGPIAWVMGNTDLKEMAAGRMDRSGEGMTKAGQIIGMVATILSIVALCIYGVVFVALLGGNRGAFR